MKMSLPAVLLAGTISVWAMSSTSEVATPGHPVIAEAGWPAGVVDLLNDPARTYGWNCWFTEWPNDVNHYEFKIEGSADVNRLLQKLSTIQAPRLRVQLNPQREAGSFGFTGRIDPKHHTAGLFFLGNQHRIDDPGAAAPRPTQSPTGSRQLRIHRQDRPKA